MRPFEEEEKAALRAHDGLAHDGQEDKDHADGQDHPPAYDELVGELEEDQSYGDMVQRASGMSRLQRIRAFFLTVYAVWFFVIVVKPNLPGVPVELTPSGLRSYAPLGYAKSGRPCPHRMASEFARGYMNNVDAAIATSGEQTDSTPSSLLAGPSQLEKLFERIFLAVPSAEGARKTLQGLTRTTHVAGSKADYRTATDVLREWASLLGADVPEDPQEITFDAGSQESIRYMTGTRQQGWSQSATSKNPLGVPRVWIDTYSVWLNYPVSSTLHLSKAEEVDRPYFRVPLAEDVLEKDPTSIDGLPPFHGYSKSGKASGPLVYAGQCSKEDFEALKQKGVNVTGAITLCRYGTTFRGLKVMLSAENGAVGTLIYSDPKEDGEVTEANGFVPYPNGPARQPSSVQRGSVQGLSIYPGDPSTPGLPSYRNASRLEPEEAESLPTIPSLPLSYRDAVPFLQALSGRGVNVEDLGGERWRGAVPGIEEYWTGPSDDIVSMDNQMTNIKEPQDIWNTYALIPGVLEDEIVILSNHRDAWTFGAGDPNSGTATVHEIAAGLGELLKTGWRPLRSILLASWDAEEYGLVGSTEAAEDYKDFFKDKATMLINVDVAVRGNIFKANASPSLKDYITQAASEIQHPSGNGSTIHINRIGPVGSGSDYTAYLQHLGIASLDAGFDRSDTDPVYHYHSNYDSFYWMDTFGDKGFSRHHAAAQLFGLLTLRGAQSLFLPINVTSYAVELDYYVTKVREIAPSDLDLSEVEKAIKDILRATDEFDEEKSKIEKELHRILAQDGDRVTRASYPPHRPRRPSPPLRRLFAKIRSLNRRAKLFETGFLAQDGKGLRGRDFYRHLGVAPGRYLGYGATTFPGVTESLTLDGGEGVVGEVRRLAHVLHTVRRNLQEGDA